MRSTRLLLPAAALFLASLNLRPAINAVSPLLPSLRAELGLNAFLASFLTAIPVLCMGLFSPLAVRVAARFGIERVVAGSLAVIVIGNALRLFATSASLLIASAIVAGIGIAAVGPLLSGFIKSRFPTRVPAMISLYTIALAAGATVSSGLSVPLENAFGSWSGSLAVWALPALAALVIWPFAVGRAPAKSDSASGEASSRSGPKLPSDSARGAAANGSRLPWGNRRAWLLTLSFGAMAMLFYSVTAWLPPIVRDMGYGDAYSGAMLTLFSIVQMPLSLALPYLLRRFPSRLFWLLAGSASLLTGFALLAGHAAPWIAAALIGIGPGILFPLNLLLPIEEAPDAGQAASWSAMTQSVGYVIGALGPVALGAARDASGGGDLAVIAGLLGIVALMVAIQLAIAGPKRRERGGGAKAAVAPKETAY